MEYVKKAELLEEIKYCYEHGITENLYNMFFKMTERFSQKKMNPNDVNPTHWRDMFYYEDMRNEAILKCIEAVNRQMYNTEKHSSPFAYFTSVIHNSFVNYHKKEKDIFNICIDGAFYNSRHDEKWLGDESKKTKKSKKYF